jgi:hypothetical protein
MNISKNIDISLNLMPAFYTKHLGIKYGQDYYFDPKYRDEIEKEEYNLLKEILSDYGVYKEEFRPSGHLFIQPIDLILRTQGAKWRFPEDATVESVGTPWANLTIKEIKKIDPLDAANHPVMEDILKQYLQMTKLYGDRADIFFAKSGLMNVHTPYTTAHQLYGEELFILMITEPDSATIIFEKIWDIYLAVFKRVQEAVGVKFSKIQMGDCSASMLSPDIYKNVVAPFNHKIASQFDWVGYHSCGPSTHLLEVFQTISPIQSIELGPGTDLARATQMMPETRICPLVDPSVMRDGNADAVEDSVSKIIEDTQLSDKILLCAWSFDCETPFENIKALYQTVNDKTKMPPK